jgi:hypothetical protein
MNSGETIWRSMGVMIGPDSPFGSQALPTNEDVDYSRQDAGFGYDQGYTMDRQPTDHANPKATETIPVGFQLNPQFMVWHIGRNQTNDAMQVAPLLRGEVKNGQRYGSYLNLIEWAPMPEVMHAGGSTGPVRHDVLPTIAKAMPGYDFAAIDGQALIDDAIARTRKALYGR